MSYKETHKELTRKSNRELLSELIASLDPVWLIDKVERGDSNLLAPVEGAELKVSLRVPLDHGKAECDC